MPRESRPACVCKQIVARVELILTAPASDLGGRACPDRHRTFLPPFTMQADHAVLNVFWPQRQRFGNPRTGIIEQQEKEMITPPDPGG